MSDYSGVTGYLSGPVVTDILVDTSGLDKRQRRGRIRRLARRYPDARVVACHSP